MENSYGVFNYFGWPTVARLQDGTLALAASGFRMRHICPFGKGVISYSSDEGQSWTLPAPVIDTPLDDRDSGIVAFGKNRAIFTSFNNSIAAQRKWATKLEPGVSRTLTEAYLGFIASMPDSEALLGSTYRMSEDSGRTFGPVRLSPVTCPHGPAPAPDGSLFYIGRRFSSDDQFDDGREPFLLCCRLNENDEFEPVSSIPNIPDGRGGCFNSCEPHALFLSQNRILVHIRVQGGCFTIYQSISEDGGNSFSRPVRLLSENGGAPAHLLKLSTGRLLSVYGYRNPPYGIRYMVSEDEGASWRTDLVLDDTAPCADLGYPSSVELQDGSILTVYYQRNEDTAKIWGIRWMI